MLSAMLSVAGGKTGTAPGTMTLTIDDGLGRVFRPGGQDPGVLVYNYYGQQMPPMWDYGFVNHGLGMITPTDFDKAKIYGYLPVTAGWLVGNLSTNQQLGCPGGHVMAEGKFGTEPGTTLDPATADALLKHFQTRAAAATEQKEQEHIKSLRVGRAFAAISALVGVGGLIVGIVALRRT